MSMVSLVSRIAHFGPTRPFWSFLVNENDTARISLSALEHVGCFATLARRPRYRHQHRRRPYPHVVATPARFFPSHTKHTSLALALAVVRQAISTQSYGSVVGVSIRCDTPTPSPPNTHILTRTHTVPTKAPDGHNCTRRTKETTDRPIDRYRCHFSTRPLTHTHTNDPVQLGVPS